MNLLKSFENEIKKCVKCGVCRAHCPVFTELRREPAVARGKIAIAAAVMSGKVAPDDRTYADMSRCLLCGTCVEKCPNDVPTDRIIIAAREALARKRGLTSFHTAVRHVLRNRGIMRLGAYFAALLKPFVFRKVPGMSGLRLRFPVPFVSRNRHFPAIAARPFMGRHPEVMPGKAGKPRVVFFVGCMTNFVYPEIGEAVLKILRHLGCTVIIPEGQQCCGFPAMSGGDLDTLSRLADKNLSALEKYQADFIMTSCASCGSALQEFYPAILEKINPRLAERCRAIADKHMDATVLLRRLDFTPRHIDPGMQGVITYHDPCHLRRRKITKEPRHLLKTVFDAEYVEMEHAGDCCGLGGTFNAYHYATSMAINRVKSESIRKSGADIVATGCPGCMVQIADGLQQQKIGARVMHTLELLARTCRLPDN